MFRDMRDVSGNAYFFASAGSVDLSLEWAAEL